MCILTYCLVLFLTAVFWGGEGLHRDGGWREVLAVHRCLVLSALRGTGPWGDNGSPRRSVLFQMISCRNGGTLQMNRSCACPQGFSGDDCATVVKGRQLHGSPGHLKISPRRILFYFLNRYKKLVTHVEPHYTHTHTHLCVCHID